MGTLALAYVLPTAAVFFIAAAVFSAVCVYLYKKINMERSIVIGMDINKKEQPKIAESAGVALLVPIWLGIFVLGMMPGFNAKVIMWGLVLSAFACIGFADDTRTKFVKKVMPWGIRSLPIAMVSLMFAYVYSPYPEWIIPIALFIAGAASFQNTFAGLNGWEVGSGLIISLAVSFLLMGTPYFLPAVILSGSVLGLLLFNAFPARVFPGDSGTLLIGSAVASLVALTGDMRIMALCFLMFLPHLFDFFALKMLTNRNDLSQSRNRPYRIMDDGRLAIPGQGGRKRYDFAKMIIRIFGPLEERRVVLIIWAVVALNCAAVLLLAGAL